MSNAILSGGKDKKQRKPAKRKHTTNVNNNPEVEMI